jgi:hypothetical protein
VKIKLFMLKALEALISIVLVQYVQGRNRGQTSRIGKSGDPDSNEQSVVP